MKKIIIYMSILLFCVGCAGINITSDSQTAVMKTTSRILGYTIAKEKPAIIDSANVFCTVILVTDNKVDLNKLIDFGINYLIEQFVDDQMIKASINDLAVMIKIDVSGTPEFDIKLIKPGVKAFQEGLLMYD